MLTLNRLSCMIVLNMRLQKKSKGQFEADISAAVTQFERDHLGRGPKEARTFIIQDMILIRLKGVLTPAEEKLAAEKDGAQLLKQVRMRLIESSRPLLHDFRLYKKIENINVTYISSNS